MQGRNWAFVDILMAVIDYFILSQFMNLLSNFALFTTELDWFYCSIGTTESMNDIMSILHAWLP